MEHPRVIGHVVSVNGFRLKVELASEAKSSSRATPDGVQRAVAINSFLTFDLGAGTHAIGILSDLEARESYDPAADDELSLQLSKPRRIASVQLLGTVRQNLRTWQFDTGITVLPTLDTPAEVANPQILAGVFGFPPRRNRPQTWVDASGDFDLALEIGHQAGDENTIVKASFNDLFSRPLAIVGNTGSGKSYTVASLLRSVLEDTNFKIVGPDPHIFILDINGEYASAFLSPEDAKYPREPNQAYVNGKPLAVPLWFMNSEEVCEWLSASEQTQQPVLKAWWAYIKGAPEGSRHSKADYLSEALSSIQLMYPLPSLTKNACRARAVTIASYLAGSGIDMTAFKEAIRPYFVKESNGEYRNFYSEPVANGPELDAALSALRAAVQRAMPNELIEAGPPTSGDTPTYVALTAIIDTSSMATAAALEDAPQIEQHLTTLRMRLRTRLTDKRWSILTNYEALNIKSARDWFGSLGFATSAHKITVLDLSMLSHEVLPFVCATIGRMLLEAREKLVADQRYQSPWVVVLEEAHNYVRPPRQNEDRGQGQSRKAFERIAKEGRKFGLSLVVASQRPSEISPTIISQCANFFSHRLQNPEDIDHFRRIIPRQAQRLLDQVTVLASGEAILFGSAVHVPARVQIRIPKEKPASVTSAPFADWTSPSEFPILEVLKAWGVTDEQATLNPSASNDGELEPISDSALAGEDSTSTFLKDDPTGETEI